MTPDTSVTARLITRLPLPLAQLYRRVCNAKTAAGRRAAAEALVEAGLRLALTLRLAGRLADGGRAELAGPVSRLLGGTPDGWVGDLREVVAANARRPDAALDPLGRADRDLLAARVPAAAGPDGPPADVFAYFEAVLGSRGRDPSDDSADRLVAAAEEVFGRDELFAGLTLGVLRRGPSDDGFGTAVRWSALHGPATLALPPDAPELAGPAGAAAVPGRVYALAPGFRLPLDPLLAFREDAYERERVGFLTAAPGGWCHLDYTGGEQFRGPDVESDVRRLLGAVAAAPPAPAPEPAPPPDAITVGDFEVADEVGQGPTGVVYRARQRSLGRWVALKVLSPAMTADPVTLARFDREVAALARCDHPNLVQILTSGCDRDRHYYAAEWVGGVNLAELAGRLRGWRAGAGRGLGAAHLGAAARGEPAPDPAADPGRPLARVWPELFAGAAAALAHLHERGVLHRGLRPEHLSLTEDRGRFRLVLTDLSWARVRDAAGSGTALGAGPGGARYLAPEQLQPGGRADERTDVYGLAATIYETVALAPLFDTGTEPELIEQVLHRPPRPVRQADPAVPAPLAEILAVCLRKDPRERYQSARDLEADLRRVAGGLPPQHRPASWWGRARTAVARRPVVAGSLTANAVLAVGFFAAVAVGYSSTAGRDRRLAAGDRQLAEAGLRLGRAQESASAAAAAADHLRAEGDGLRQQVAALGRRAAAAETGEVVAGRSAARADYARRVTLAVREWEASRPGAAEAWLDGCPAALRGWEWNHLRRRCRGELVAVRNSHNGVPFAVAFSPDGRLFASGGGSRTAGGNVRLYDAATGEHVLLTAAHEGEIRGVAFTPGRQLVTAGTDGLVAVWDVERAPDRARPLRAIGPIRGEVVGLAVWADGGRAATVARPGLVQPGRADPPGVDVWDLKAGQRLRSLPRQAADPVAVAVRDDGRELAVAYKDRAVRRWDPETGEKVGTLGGFAGEVLCVAYGPGGRRLAAGSYFPDGTGQVRVFDADTGEPVVGFAAGPGPVARLAFGPDGTRVATAAAGTPEVRLWDAATGGPAGVIRGHTDEVTALAFHPTAPRLLTASRDRSARVWDVTAGEPGLTAAPLGEDDRVVAVAPNGRLVAAGGRRGARVWDRTGRAAPVTLGGLAGPVTGLAFSANGRRLAAAAGKLVGSGGKSEWKGEVVVFDAVTGDRRRTLPAARGPVAFLADGKQIVYPGDDGVVRVHEVEGEKPAGELPGRGCDALSADGAWLVRAADRDGRPALELWDVGRAERRAVWPLPPGVARFGAAAVDPSGSWAAVGTRTGVHAFSTATGRHAWSAPVPEGGAEVLAFGPDGTRLLAGPGSPEPVGLRLWHAGTGDELLCLRSPELVWAPRFGADGAALFALGHLPGGRQPALLAWDAPAVRPSVTLRPGGDLRAVAFSPDGRHVLTGGDLAPPSCWDPADRRPADWPGAADRPDDVAALAVSAAGRRVAVAAPDGPVRVWDWAGGKRLFEAGVGERAVVKGLAFSPGGDRLAVAANEVRGGKGQVLILDGRSGERLRALPAGTGEVNGLAFTPDGSRLVAAGGEFDEARGGFRAGGVVRVWDTTTWAVAYTLEGGVDARTGRGNDRDPALPVLSVAVAGDGRYLAVGGWEAQVRVRDTGTGREHRAFPVHTPTHAVAFSPDGRWLLAAGFDGVLRVWDVNSAELVAAVAEHTDKIWAMSFSPDGRSLATASADGTVRLFEFAALVPR